MILEEMLDRVAQGGPVMIPLALVSFAAWALIAERWFWIRRQRGSAGKLDALQLMVKAGDFRRAAKECEGSPSISARAACAFLSALSSSRGACAPHLAREASLREFGLARRGLALIATLAAVAPLLGLLGTVFGMIETFDAITLHGTGNPRVLAEGISEALLTTQAGLIVALPVLLAHGWLRRKCELVERGAEDFLARVLAAAQVAPEAQESGEVSP